MKRPAAMKLNVNLSLQRREGFSLQVIEQWSLEGITAITGPSGSGKTTLLRCLAGLEKDCQGQLLWGDDCWLDSAQSITVPAPERRCGVVFQDDRLFPHLNVAGNLEYAHRRRQGNGPELDELVTQFGLQELIHYPVGKLSGGQRKRVAIARALASAPRWLLMDEPLSGLDQVAADSILKQLTELCRRWQLPVVYVSHSLREIAAWSDRLILMDQGRVTAQGDIAELCTDLSLGLSHNSDAISVLQARTQAADADGLQAADLAPGAAESGATLWLSESELPAQQNVRLQIAARDVSLSLSPASDSSIVNILPAEIETISDDHQSQCLIRLRCGGQILLARITRRSAKRLQLEAGQRVYAQIKSVALLSAAPARQLCDDAPHDDE